MENIPNMSPRFLAVIGVIIAAIIAAVAIDDGDGLPSTPLDKTIASKYTTTEAPASVKTLSGNDTPFLLLGTKGTKYDTHTFDRHPETGQKGHWMQIRVKKGSLHIKNGSDSVILEPSNNPPFINLDELEDLNDLD